MMGSKQIQNWRRKIVCLWTCLLVGFSPAWSQSFAEALQAGQSIKVEWIQQNLKDNNARPASPTPLFPDALEAGESEIRVDFLLKSVEGGSRLVAEVKHIKYLALPSQPEMNPAAGLLPDPIILDTRFQDVYFKPQLFLLDALRQQSFPVSCQSKAYESLLDQFAQAVRQSDKAAALLPAQLDWLEATTLPSVLSASSLADFFCALRDSAVPASENTFLIQSEKNGEGYQMDYVRVDHPPRMTLLKGNIQSPANELVRVQFFRQGSWLDYWQDSLVQLDRQGNFRLAFPLDQSRFVTLFHGFQSMRFYLEPGDTLELSTNANAFYREMEITGRSRAENEFLLQFYHELRGDTLFRRYDDDFLDKDYLFFFQQQERIANKELAFLAAQTGQLRPEFVALWHQYLQLDHASQEWEAAYRFMAEKGMFLQPALVRRLQKKARLLYRLPEDKIFDFDVEDYLSFQFYLLQNAYNIPRLGAADDRVLAQLLPSQETTVRHILMQLFRQYTEQGTLTKSGQWQLEWLLDITRDSQWVREMAVFTEKGRPLPRDFGFRTLQAGKMAPAWSYPDQEGVRVALKDLMGKKVLMHVGQVDNLDRALTDIQLLRKNQDQLPVIVHLLEASSKNQFNRQVAGQAGLFVFVPPEEMTLLKERYFIDNSSNHYFLIDESGRILANHYDLGTAKKLRGAWEKAAEPPKNGGWTAEQKIRFWQVLGIAGILLFMISGAFLWQRRITMRRDLRQRQLLEVELRGIRSQMNPHFLFNAMSAIQNLIRKKEQEKADLYLGQFAGLMRKTLRNSAEEYIPLADEMEMLTQYCSLESLRHPFQYEFQVDDSIDKQNTYIPSMILQPIIENAILHGLAPQSGARTLLVEIGPGEKGLNCTVTDSGIGALAAKKQSEQKDHQSMGIQLIRQRLALLGLKGEEHLTIKDRSTFDPPASGTLVYLTIPTEQ